MDFDQTKKIEVEVSENVIAENEVGVRSERKKSRFASFRKVDPLDVALLPVIVGVFISLGFLFPGLFGQSSTAAEVVSGIGSTVASVF